MGSLLGGRYLVQHLIGAGAMGRVYRAWHLGLGRACAVKVIREPRAPFRRRGKGDLATDTVRASASPFGDETELRRRSSVGPRRSSLATRDEALARFHIEARAMSRLDHPNIVQILDFGCDVIEEGVARPLALGAREARVPLGAKQLWYLVTEHLDGEDLVDRMNAEPILSTPRIVSIMRQLCEALQHAHDAGVIHRDIKPENVRLVPRVAEDGSHAPLVKLLDFGTARLLRDDARGPLAGALAPPPLDEDGGQLVIGTPAYMSPEQASGQGVDARSDIYSCGVLLFEMATGRLPFDRPTPIALAAAHVECTPPPPSAFNEAIDPELEALILQCLRKHPDDRPPSARAVREALDRLLSPRSSRVVAREATAIHELLRPLDGAPLATASHSRPALQDGGAELDRWSAHSATWVGHGGALLLRPSSAALITIVVAAMLGGSLYTALGAASPPLRDRDADLGHGESHRHGPAHGEPTGPGDAPALGEGVPPGEPRGAAEPPRRDDD